MNREIKFRAFDDGKMLSMPINSNYGISRFFGILREDAVIMQFTGLKDKNGKEIYEGDKVQHDAWDYPFEVIFNEEKARFVCKLETGLTQYIDYERLVVVGDVF